MDFSSVSKAIAGGLVGAGLSVLAHFGFQPHGTTITAISVVVTAVVGYVVGHVVVFLAPQNTAKVTPTPPVPAPPVEPLATDPTPPPVTPVVTPSVPPVVLR